MPTLTMELPPDLLAQAEAAVQASGRPLPDLVQEALRAYFEDLLDDAACTRVALEAKARLASGEEHWLDWEGVKAELDALPD